MTNITYVTGNYGKYVSVKEKFERCGLEIKYVNIDINEPDINDIEYISYIKAQEAYKQVNSPVFVVDSGFYIRSYPNNPNYPGAFVKRSKVASDVNKLIEEMKNIKDRYCYFMDCLTYFDGNDYIQFLGKSEGTLSLSLKGNELKKAKSNLWYVFIPKNCNKTLAEMTDEERNNRNDGRSDATIEFINWLQNNKSLEKNIKKLTK